MGAAVHGGCTVILKKSFSASKFWPDVVKYKVTVGQYIGEIARFLLGKQSFIVHIKHARVLLYWEYKRILACLVNIAKNGQNLAKSGQN